jgi:hypothetical protein
MGLLKHWNEGINFNVILMCPTARTVKTLQLYTVEINKAMTGCKRYFRLIQHILAYTTIRVIKNTDNSQEQQ